MEEYRRKYLSPSYRNSAVTEVLSHDKSVSELRQELHECRQMETKFDDLSLEILRLERENKTLEGEKASIQEGYMEKLRKNKDKIQKLKFEVEECRESIKDNMEKVRDIDQENDRLRAELTRIEGQREKNQVECSQVKKDVEVKEEVQKEVNYRIEEIKEKVREINTKNQKTTEEMEREYRQLKKNQLQLKEEEEGNCKLKIQLAALKEQRKMWEKKAELGESQVAEMNSEYALNKSEESRFELECLSLDKQNQRLIEVYSKSKSDAKKMMLQNSELSLKLKKKHEKVFEALTNLDKSRQYHQKMSVREMELKKENEKLWDIAGQLSQTIKEEQDSYNRIISHMRQSIQQDEQAIENLVKQATTIETMIN